MSTLRASETGLLKIDRARRLKGWLKQSEAWCRMAQTSRATLKRFWRREAIDQGTFIAICAAVGLQDWEPLVATEQVTKPLQLSLELMPDVPLFFGRGVELQQLMAWSDRCRLIVLWGMGGIGKTSLVAEWIENLVREGKHSFATIAWRSMQTMEGLAIETLQQQRGLFILDSWELLLGEAAGQVKPELNAFSQMLQQFATSRHNSCVIVISREKPAELLGLEGANPSVQSYKLEGLGQNAIALLQSRGLQEEPTAWQTLIQLYRGHPLALNMIASLIQDLCQGSTTAFLKMNTIVVHQLDNLLAERIQSLSTIETSVLQLLAKCDRPMPREWLQAQLELTSSSELLSVLLSLERRCLLEILSEDTVAFALPPVVQKYVVQRLLTKDS
jgi:GTPase SAR1 family protein